MLPRVTKTTVTPCAGSGCFIVPQIEQTHTKKNIYESFEAALERGKIKQPSSPHPTPIFSFSLSLLSQSHSLHCEHTHTCGSLTWQPRTSRYSLVASARFGTAIATWFSRVTLWTLDDLVSCPMREEINLPGAAILESICACVCVLVCVCRRQIFSRLFWRYKDIIYYFRVIFPPKKKRESFL